MNKLDEFKVAKLKVQFTPFTKVTLPPFMPHLILGSVINVGKGTSAGMGMYEMFVRVG